MIKGWIWRKAGNIFCNGPSFGRLVHGDEFSEEFSVPECLPSGSVYSDEVLVELAYLNDYASPVHLFG